MELPHIVRPVTRIERESPLSRSAADGSRAHCYLTVESTTYWQVYHTRRMQRVFCVKWTLDNRFILSGSDGAQLRVVLQRRLQLSGVLQRRLRRDDMTRRMRLSVACHA